MSKVRTQYFVSGWIAIFIGAILFAAFLLDYHHGFLFKKYSTLSDLGAIISATTGTCFSLAGLLFILDSLETQRKTIQHQQESIEQQKDSIDLQRLELKNQIQEMKESNEYFRQQSETLKIQTAENSFFKLIDNHRSLIESISFGPNSGYEGLNGYYKLLKESVEIYFQAGYTGDVYKKQIPTYYPANFLKFQIENINQFLDNIGHIVNFIEVKLENDIFYHETLYSFLSNAEKYIIGLVLYNYKKEKFGIFVNSNFNYLKFFEGSGNAFYIEGRERYIPELIFELDTYYFPFDSKDYLKHIKEGKFGKVKISVLENIYKKQIKLRSVIIEYNWNNKNVSDEVEWEMIIDKSISINLNKEIRDHLMPRFIEHYNDKTRFYDLQLPISLVFSIQYGESNYSFRYRYEFRGANVSKDSLGGIQFQEK